MAQAPWGSESLSPSRPAGNDSLRATQTRVLASFASRLPTQAVSPSTLPAPFAAETTRPHAAAQAPHSIQGYAGQAPSAPAWRSTSRAVSPERSQREAAHSFSPSAHAPAYNEFHYETPAAYPAHDRPNPYQQPSPDMYHQPGSFEYSEAAAPEDASPASPSPNRELARRQPSGKSRLPEEWSNGGLPLLVSAPGNVSSASDNASHHFPSPGLQVCSRRVQC